MRLKYIWTWALLNFIFLFLAAQFLHEATLAIACGVFAVVSSYLSLMLWMLEDAAE